MNLPKRIDPCPIIDSLLELRFKTSFPHDAIFGIVYNELKSKYQEYESLPILQLPEPIRKNEPNLRFKPYYKISNDKFVIQIGAEVLTISSHPEYLGWDLFEAEINEFLSIVKKLGIVDSITRIGLRVINFFPEEDIFDKTNIKMQISGKDLASHDTHLKTVFDHDSGIKSTINVANNNNLNSVNGSVIDIDTYIESIIKLGEANGLINKIHISEKELFFSLLKTDYLESLNPTY